MKKIICLIIAILLILSLTSCEKNQQAVETEQPDSVAEPSSAVKEPEYYSISFIPHGYKNNVDNYYYRVKAGCEQAIADLKEQNVNIRFSFDPANHNMDIPIWKYSQIIEYKNNTKDAILFTPVGNEDYDEDIETFKTAKDKGIKTILIDSALSNDYWNAAYLTNHYESGKLLAELMIKELESRGVYSGKIALIGYHKSGGSFSLMACSRELGFRSAFENKGYELMDTNYSSGDIQMESEFIERQIANGKINDIVAIAGFCYTGAYSISNTLEKNGLSDSIITGAFDALAYCSAYDESPDNLADVMYFFESGALNICIDKDPYQMGYQGIIGAVELLRGNEVDPKVVDIPPIVVTKENYKEYYDAIDRQVKSAENSSTEIVEY